MTGASSTNPTPSGRFVLPDVALRKVIKKPIFEVRVFLLLSRQVGVEIKNLGHLLPDTDDTNL